jgi:hypothetical protein
MAEIINSQSKPIFIEFDDDTIEDARGKIPLSHRVIQNTDAFSPPQKKSMTRNKHVSSKAAKWAL